MTSSVLPDLDRSKRQLMQIFEDPHLKGVVQHVFAIISELNEISTRLHRATREKNIFEEKYFTLYREHVKLKTSKSGKQLHELDENKIDVENGLSHGENFPIIKTSPKTENNSSLQLEENTDLTVEIQETLLDIPASPILRKSKNKTSKSNSCNETFESPNKLKLIDKENSHVIAKSYTNVSDNFTVIDELKAECSKTYITPSISKLKKQSRKFSNTSVNRKSLVNLKQSRIHFKNTKSKNAIDISKSNSFLGGVRNFTSEIKNDSEKKPVPLLKFENYSEENIDCIEESPSCISHKQTRIKKHTFPELLIPKVEEKIFDDDETILIIPPKNIKKNSENSIAPCEQESNQKQKLLKNNESLLCGFPIKDTSDEIISNRKKANKNKLPGWSCKKCSDFYSVAFKGNEEMIRKKMNECSKHRGRVNPERNNTPPGFWDVNMPQTPTDNENN